MSALETIQSYGIPTNDYVAAIQTINNNGRFHKDRYEQMIGEIFGDGSIFTAEDEKQARLYFLYTVQECVRAGEDNNLDDIRAEVERRVGFFNTHYSWALVSDEDNTEESEQKVDAVGNPKQKKGAKKEIAKKVWEENKDKGYSRKQFIELLVNQVGLSSAGASTYYSNLKAGRF